MIIINYTKSKTVNKSKGKRQNESKVRKNMLDHLFHKSTEIKWLQCLDNVGGKGPVHGKFCAQKHTKDSISSVQYVCSSDLPLLSGLFF